MTLLDYTQLHDPTAKPHLWITYDPTHEVLRWQILDANRDHQLYSRAATLDHAVAFMRAAVKKGDATVDEFSIAFHLMLAGSGGAAGTGSSPPDDFSRAVLADVIPFPSRKEVA